MFASVFIKDGKIYFYNEKGGLSNLGGIAYELGRPLLDFICYEPERFDDDFTMKASVLDHPFAYLSVKSPEFINQLREHMTEAQQREVYVYFYEQMYYDFVYAFLDSPRQAILQLAEKIPGTVEKLQWAMDFEWPTSKLVEVIFPDSEKRLYRAATDVVELMSKHLKSFQKFIISEIEVLLHYRKAIEVPSDKPMDYLEVLEEYHEEIHGRLFYLDKPFRSFYGRTTLSEIAELYEINTVEDLFRFEFIKMIEHDIFIKKCKNCERFFIPRRRVDAEYCERTFGNGGRKCSEIGATLRYEKKVAENPVLEAYSKAYKRFNSRTRAKKMTQSEFLSWSEQARKKRDECLAGDLAFEEFVAWLEQGRMRRSKGSGRHTREIAQIPR